MSLIDEMMEDCTIINHLKVDDPEGGTIDQWVDGAKIKAVIVLSNSTTAKVAEAQGVTSLYTITTSKDIKLDFHDVIRREKDGKIFRVTSDAGDIESPNTSGLDIAQVSAEKWRLTT